MFVKFVGCSEIPMFKSKKGTLRWKKISKKISIANVAKNYLQRNKKKWKVKLIIKAQNQANRRKK